MNYNLSILIVSPVIFLLACDVSSAQQRPRSGSELRTLGEVTLLKQAAEAGECGAQVALGRTLAMRARPTDALAWYRKAADQGSVEAASLAGELLLFGKAGEDDSQRVMPRLEDGVKLTYFAATNRYGEACRSMSVAYQRGLSVQTNLTEAYAWLRLYAEADPARRKRELDALGLTLTAGQLEQAGKLIRDFNQGKWPALEICRDYQKESRLKLSGVMFGGRFPLAIINRRTIAEGESALIPVTGGALNIKCLKIKADSVLVAIEQELEPRLISLY
jgi:hypothetical protein